MASRVLPAAVCASLLALAACGGGSTSTEPGEPADSEPDTSAAADESSDETATTGAPATTAAPTTAAPTTTIAPLPEVTIDVAGPEELVFDYSEGNCDGLARPDLPARAMRVGDQVSVVLSHTVNQRLIGADFDTLALSCDPILSSAYDHDPAAHAHHEWIGATWVEPGTEVVHAVVHNEFHGYASELADSRRAILDGEDPGDWQYVARTPGGGEAPMSPGDSGFVAGGLCAVDFWGAHPDVGCDAVSRWMSGRDGELVIDIDTTKVGVGGDGVIVDVRVDGAEVWSVALTDDASTASERLTVPVSIGSAIDIGVSAGGDASFDATEIRTVITPDGERCTADTWTCTRVELTAARSDDGGATFAPTATPPALVATPPGVYEHDLGFTAMWQPSNIVAHPDGGHVMIVQYDNAITSDQYSCLLRTDDIADAAAWRAWDGEAFTLAAVDPWVTGEVAPACARVAPAPISGLSYHAESGLFVAVGGFAQFRGGDGQYALVSHDLITWSDPIFIQAADFVFTGSEPPWEPYATLIDHASDSPNFDTIGATPYLYFTRINDPNELDFDLVRVPLEITVAPG